MTTGQIINWTVGSDHREALVFAPSIEGPGAKHPVIFAFHGHGGKIKNTADQMDFQHIWPEAVVVYPQGLDAPGAVHDPHGKAPGWQLRPGDEDDRDLKLFDRMLETIRQKSAVDNRRIYAAGFSNGAIFCYVLWSQRASTLAAIGGVAGRLWPGTQLSSPLPDIHIAGIIDSSILFAWQIETIGQAQKTNNLDPWKQGQEGGDCCGMFGSSSPAPVKALFHNGGHVYPPFASAEMVTFFKNHPQP